MQRALANCLRWRIWGSCCLCNSRSHVNSTSHSSDWWSTFQNLVSGSGFAVVTEAAPQCVTKMSKIIGDISNYCQLKTIRLMINKTLKTPTFNPQKSNTPQKLENEQVDLSPQHSFPLTPATWNKKRHLQTLESVSNHNAAVIFYATPSLRLHPCSHLPGRGNHFLRGALQHVVQHILAWSLPYCITAAEISVCFPLMTPGEALSLIHSCSLNPRTQAQWTFAEYWIFFFPEWHLALLRSWVLIPEYFKRAPPSWGPSEKYSLSLCMSLLKIPNKKPVKFFFLRLAPELTSVANLLFFFFFSPKTPST